MRAMTIELCSIVWGYMKIIKLNLCICKSGSMLKIVCISIAVDLYYMASKQHV